jgi:WD40 repeat protein
VNLSNKGTDLDQESYWDYYAKTYFDRKTNVKLSPNGKLLIIGKQDSIAKVMNFETGRMEYDLKCHSAAVISFDFSPDSKLIATGSGDKRIKIWNAQDGTLIRTIKGHRDMVFSVHFSKDGKHLLSSGWDGNAYIWNVETGEEVNWFKDVKAFTSDFSPFGNYIVTGGLDKHFSLWEQDASLMFRRLSDIRMLFHHLIFMKTAKQSSQVHGTEPCVFGILSQVFS